MERAKKVPVRRKAVAGDALGPGVHAGVVEMASGQAFRVRTTLGVRVRAKPDVGVSRAFVERCLKSGRRVLVTEGEDGPVIVGAIETSDETAERPLVLAAKDIRLRAVDSLTLEVGQSSLRLEKTGALRVQGNRMVVDVAALVRFLSARVELP